MERLIYSERLLKKLEALRQARIAVLEAPAGYGKTTAVSRALEGAATAVWYTGVEHLPDTSFYWFIRQLSAGAARAGRRREAGGGVRASRRGWWPWRRKMRSILVWYNAENRGFSS